MKVRFAPVVPVAGVAYKAVVRGVRHSEWKLAPQIGLQRELGVSDPAVSETALTGQLNPDEISSNVTDAPEPRVVQSQDVGPVTSEPILDGLHHRYYRDAA